MSLVLLFVLGSIFSQPPPLPVVMRQRPAAVFFLVFPHPPLFFYSRRWLIRGLILFVQPCSKSSVFSYLLLYFILSFQFFFFSVCTCSLSSLFFFMPIYADDMGSSLFVTSKKHGWIMARRESITARQSRNFFNFFSYHVLYHVNPSTNISPCHIIHIKYIVSCHIMSSHDISYNQIN